MVRLSGIAVSFFLLLAIAGISESRIDPLKEAFTWKTVEFKYPNATLREEDIKSGKLIPENVFPLAFEIWKNKMFITLPRWKPGIPVSLAYINLDDPSGNQSPDLTPYPDWESNQLNEIGSEKNETRIALAVRAFADVCDRLWVIDMGLASVAGSQNKVLLPQVLIFDLKTDKLIKKHPIEKEKIRKRTFLTNIIVDVTKNTCDKAFAYIADTDASALIVYDLQNDSSWRIDHPYFHFDPLAGNLLIGEVNYQVTDGIFGLALSPVSKDGTRTLFFHPLASSYEFAVPTKVVQNRTNADSYYEYKVLGSRGPNSQSTVSSYDDKTGVIFYTLLNRNAIGCWNSIKHADEYSADTTAILSSDREALVYPNHLKVDENGILWVLSDRLPVYYFKQLDVTDTNYRILTAPVAELIKGTACDSS